MVFIKEFFERVDFGKNSADNKNPNHITLHAKSVFSLKCVFFNITERCETAIEINGPLYKHLQLSVGPNLLKVSRLNKPKSC